MTSFIGGDDIKEKASGCLQRVDFHMVGHCVHTLSRGEQKGQSAETIENASLTIAAPGGVVATHGKSAQRQKGVEIEFHIRRCLTEEQY